MQYCLPSSKHLCCLVVCGLVLSPVSSSRTRNALAAEDFGYTPVEWLTHHCELTHTWRRHPRDYRLILEKSCSRWCPSGAACPSDSVGWVLFQAGGVLSDSPASGLERSPSVASFPFTPSPPQQTLFISYSTLRPQIRVTPSRRHLQIPLRKQKLRLPGSSAGKESACGAGDPGLIPGSRRCLGEGISYLL